MKVLRSSSAAGAVVFGQYLAALGNGRFMIRLLDSDATRMTMFLGNIGSFSTFSIDLGVIPQNDWTSVAVTRSGSVFAGYVGNSKTIHTDIDATRTILQAGNVLGARTATTPYNGDLTAFWAGSIAEVGVWSDALTDDEIGSLSVGASPSLVKPQSLISYIPLINQLSDHCGIRQPVGTAITMDDHPRIYL
jgi:hypothetical protein